MEICIDFDGTCVTHDYPLIGKDIGAIPVLKAITNNGHNIILFTMRSKEPLNDAVNWFKDNDIPLYGINTNPKQKEWTDSPKAYGQLYIDDAALGSPLLFNKDFSERHYLNWEVVEMFLKIRKII